MDSKEFLEKYADKLAAIAAGLGYKLELQPKNYCAPAILHGGEFEADLWVRIGNQVGAGRAEFSATYSKLYQRFNQRETYSPGISAAVSMERTAPAIVRDLQKRLIIPTRDAFKAQAQKLSKLAADAAEELAYLLNLLEPLHLDAADLPTLEKVKQRTYNLYAKGIHSTSAYELTAPLRGSTAYIQIQIKNPHALRQIFQILAAENGN